MLLDDRIPVRKSNPKQSKDWGGLGTAGADAVNNQSAANRPIALFGGQFAKIYLPN